MKILSSKQVHARWLAQLFSTEPADRAEAEAAVHDLYVAAGFEAPRHVIWFDSPLEAAWTMGLLVEPHYPAWQRLVAANSQISAVRDRLERTRSNLSKMLGQARWEDTLTEVGLPMGRWLQPAPGRARRIVQSEIVLGRMRLYGDDFSRMTKADGADELQSAELALWAAGREVLNYQKDWRDVGLMVALSFYSDYQFSMMAQDELRAGDEQPPAALKAAWTIARSAGMWWPCANTAILTDRPAEIHTNDKWLLHRGEGPAATYRNGVRVYAWEGVAMPEDWILHPETIPAGKLRECPSSYRKYVAARVGVPASKAKAAKPSAILKAELPHDPVARLDEHASTQGGVCRCSSGTWRANMSGCGRNWWG